MQRTSYGYKADPGSVWLPNPTLAVRRKAGRGIFFPEEGKWIPTPNVWVFGYDPKAKRWAATNGRDNARWFFRKEDLLAYAKRMVSQWNWEYVQAL